MPETKMSRVLYLMANGLYGTRNTLSSDISWTAEHLLFKHAFYSLENLATTFLWGDYAAKLSATSNWKQIKASQANAVNNCRVVQMYL